MTTEKPFDKLSNEEIQKLSNKQLQNLSVEQLKKIEEKVNKNISQGNKSTFAPKINVIDKFTNMDELIIENTQRLNVLINKDEELIKQMQISNQLLLALYIEEAEDGTMVARAPNGIDTSAILREIGQGGGRNTIIHSIPNFSGDSKAFELTGSGFVIEIMFKSLTSSTDNKDYSVRVKADDTIIYQDSFTNFKARNHFERDMTCYEDTRTAFPYYFLHFKNISYRNSFTVEIYESNARFEQIYLKYEED